MSTDRPKYVDPNTIPDFYRKNPDYQGEDVIESLTPDTRDPVTPLTAEEEQRLRAEFERWGISIQQRQWFLRLLATLDAARQSDGAEADPDIDRRLLEDEDGAPYPDAVQEVVHEWQREAFAAGYMKAVALQAAPVSVDREAMAAALHEMEGPGRHSRPRLTRQICPGPGHHLADADKMLVALGLSHAV